VLMIFGVSTGSAYGNLNLLRLRNSKDALWKPEWTERFVGSCEVFLWNPRDNCV
jgi:hypothetical protein